MERLQIPVLPSIVTAVLITTIVSAGNAYTFNTSRSLHALALEGQAPKFLRRLNNKGVPYLAVIVVMALACLASLALGSTSAKILNWILKNWTVMAITWIRFNAAMKAQVIDRETSLPVRSRFQPYVQGYAVFLSGNWSTATFIFNYGIIALAGSIGLGWKLFKKTRAHRHEHEVAPQNLKDKILAKIFEQIVGNR
ncbi:amino acid permease-domain-containing protein [Fusarium sp. MPI-SDFR-AT-0072]|nr:amino acid permease-domain-containing protein [Fusarium sp. MPI-SDFR-AT-0072]